MPFQCRKRRSRNVKTTDNHPRIVACSFPLLKLMMLAKLLIRGLPIEVNGFKRLSRTAVLYPAPIRIALFTHAKQKKGN